MVFLTLLSPALPLHIAMRPRSSLSRVWILFRSCSRLRLSKKEARGEVGGGARGG
jgi:hypothetical protein